MNVHITWLLGSCPNLGGGGLGGGFFFTGCWNPLSDFDGLNESTFANLDWVLKRTKSYHIFVLLFNKCYVYVFSNLQRFIHFWRRRSRTVWYFWCWNINNFMNNVDIIMEKLHKNINRTIAGSESPIGHLETIFAIF